LKLIYSVKNAPTRYLNLLKHKKGDQYSYYFNRSGTLVHCDIKNNDPKNVDSSRIKNYRLVHYGDVNQVQDKFSLEQLRLINTLHEVKEVYVTDDNLHPQGGDEVQEVAT